MSAGVTERGARRAAPARRQRRGTAARVALGAVVPLVLLAWWWVGSQTGAIRASQFPSPEGVVRAAVELAATGDLWRYTAISLQRVLIGFAIGAGVGVAVGAVVGLSRLGAALLGPSLAGLRAVPSLAWVPLLLIWVGLGEESKIILVAIGAFFPVFTTVAGSLAHVDANLVEAARAFGLRGARLFTTVQLPAVLPSLVSGLRLALAQAWLFLVAAELLSASMGLGYLMTESQNNGRVDRIILAILMLAVLGVLTDALLRVAERITLRRWS